MIFHPISAVCKCDEIQATYARHAQHGAQCLLWRQWNVLIQAGTSKGCGSECYLGKSACSSGLISLALAITQCKAVKVFGYAGCPGKRGNYFSLREHYCKEMETVARSLKSRTTHKKDPATLTRRWQHGIPRRHVHRISNERSHRSVCSESQLFASADWHLRR